MRKQIFAVALAIASTFAIGAAQAAEKAPVEVAYSASSSPIYSRLPGAGAPDTAGIARINVEMVDGNKTTSFLLSGFTGMTAYASMRVTSDEPAASIESDGNKWSLPTVPDDRRVRLLPVAVSKDGAVLQLEFEVSLPSEGGGSRGYGSKQEIALKVGETYNVSWPDGDFVSKITLDEVFLR